MKKIIYLHASADMYGSDYVLLNLLKNLDNTKYKTLVLLPYKGKLCIEFDKNNISYLVCEIPVIRRQLFSLKGIFKYIIQSIRFFIFLSNIIKKENIDIIHTNTAAIWLGGFTAYLYKKKHIWQVMELIEKPYIISYLIRKIVGIFSTKVFSISTAVNNYFLQLNQTRKLKFQVLYHGVDLDIYDPNNNQSLSIRKKLSLYSDTILVGMAGRINGWKGHEVFVKAIPIVRQNIKNSKISFVIIGDAFKGQEHFESELNSIISNTDVGSNLSIFGFQNNFEDWLAAMDIFVLPSILPEPNATVTIAAMAMEKPVIGTNLGGTSETIIDNETGFLIPPNNEYALADSILYFINNQDKILEFGKKGSMRIKHFFSLKNYCHVIADEYSRE